jgi:hypothetical protein
MEKKEKVEPTVGDVVQPTVGDVVQLCAALWDGLQALKLGNHAASEIAIEDGRKILAKMLPIQKEE